MIVVDVETTGVDARKHSLVSIGAVDFNNPTNHFYQECRIGEGAVIDPVALDINGFTREQITDLEKPSHEQTIRDFFSWLQNCGGSIILAGHNCSMDRDFIAVPARKYGLHVPFSYRTVDLHSLCYAHHLQQGKGKKLSLNDVLQYVGLPEEPHPHNGLTGAKMIAEAFSRLIYSQSLLQEFSQFAVPEHLKTTTKTFI